MKTRRHLAEAKHAKTCVSAEPRLVKKVYIFKIKILVFSVHYQQENQLTRLYLQTVFHF